jgi:hypothetical protein
VKFSDLPPDYQKGMDDLEIIFREILNIPVSRFEILDEYDLVVSAQWLFEDERISHPFGGARVVDGKNHFWLARATKLEFEVYDDMSIYKKDQLRRSEKSFVVRGLNSSSGIVVESFLEEMDISPLSLLFSAEDVNRK